MVENVKPARRSPVNKRAEPRGARTVVREPIHEQILPHIRRDIVLNRWGPGERLPEMELCHEFGVSRTPLRNVLKILEVEGLIELVPHIGAVVTPFDSPDLAEKLDVMSGLEQLAAVRIAQLRPPEALSEIQRLHSEMNLAALDTDRTRYYALNDEFHRAIVLGSGNATLSKMHETIMWHVSRARNFANEQEVLGVRAAEHHTQIVEMILSGDAEGARLAMRTHLDDVISNILARFGPEQTIDSETGNDAA
ncbi:MAG: GntR family transcriptional regulator [Confluentimicrobium sp.]|uniref:DNA-binding GntR family transcriptional regulator n=1 Tax=Actibacterium naphthalenivorans TaxID=1614693 RepID=A0A840CD32_9RHOB|nr:MULTISPECIES: GntR family transcriptional regulator [Actibacterium]MBB4023991.1 DNA-binding GntR family transcriptional regulator [Actibacterium naphthalenivorans]MBC57155.1 GntR family transcriptional regulator [Actibacterium sp.]